MIRHIQRIMEEKRHERGWQEGNAPNTIFHTLLDSNLPDEEKSLERLWQEAFLIVAAGSDTTGNAMTTTTFHLLKNPDMLAKLRKELEAAIPNRFQPVKLSTVEKLPYLVSRQPHSLWSFQRQPSYFFVRVASSYFSLKTRILRPILFQSNWPKKFSPNFFLKLTHAEFESAVSCNTGGFEVSSIQQLQGVSTRHLTFITGYHMELALVFNA